MRQSDQTVSINVTGLPEGMSAISMPAGQYQLALVLDYSLGDVASRYEVIGLNRLTGDVFIQESDENCDDKHVHAFSVDGILVDSEGPFPDPAPEGCGYGRIIETELPIRGGGVREEDSYDSDGCRIKLGLAQY